MKTYINIHDNIHRIYLDINKCITLSAQILFNKNIQSSLFFFFFIALLSVLLSMVIHHLFELFDRLISVHFVWGLLFYHFLKRCIKWFTFFFRNIPEEFWSICFHLLKILCNPRRSIPNGRFWFPKFFNMFKILLEIFLYQFIVARTNWNVITFDRSNHLLLNLLN